MTQVTGQNPTVASTPPGGEQAQFALGLLDGLYALMRAVLSLGPNHPSAAEMAENVASAAAGLTVPYSLQLLGASAYWNRSLLPVDIERVAQVLQVARALDALGAQELVFDRPLHPQTLLLLTQVLVRPAESAAVQVPGVLWRPLTGPVWGDGGKPIDRDVVARVWLARAATMVERLDHSEEAPWPWAVSAGVIRRIEQVLHLDSAIALRALELAPQPWLPGRRAVAVAVRAMVMLGHVGASLETRRVVGHAGLLAAVHGFASDRTRAFDVAAQTALHRANQQAGVDVAVSARHRLRVAGLLQALAQRAGSGGSWPGALGALLVSWELEQRRGNGIDGVQRNTLEALVDAENDPYLLGGRAWLRAFIASSSILPPGSVVVDDAQQLAVVLDASGRSGGGRPMLVSGAQMVQGQAQLVPFLRLS